jgi:hypothetical protein
MNALVRGVTVSGMRCAPPSVFKGTGTIWLRCPVTSESGALQMFSLTELGQPLEISLERLGQCVSL